jgi:hypothetical protein
MKQIDITCEISRASLTYRVGLVTIAAERV